MEEIINYVLANKVDLIAALLAALGLASIIARLTPTDADNKFLDKVYKLIQAIGLNK